MIADTKFKANSHRFHVSFILLLVDTVRHNMTFLVNINFDTLDHELKLQKAVHRHVRSTVPLHIPGTNAATWEAWPCIHLNWNTQLTPVENKCILVAKLGFWNNSLFIFYQRFHILLKYRWSHNHMVVKMYFTFFTLKHLIIMKSVWRTKAPKASNVTNTFRKLSSKYVSTYFSITSHKRKSLEVFLFPKLKSAPHFLCNAVPLKNQTEE